MPHIFSFYYSRSPLGVLSIDLIKASHAMVLIKSDAKFSLAYNNEHWFLVHLSWLSHVTFSSASQHLHSRTQAEEEAQATHPGLWQKENKDWQNHRMALKVSDEKKYMPLLFIVHCPKQLQRLVLYQWSKER